MHQLSLNEFNEEVFQHLKSLCDNYFTFYYTYKGDQGLQIFDHKGHRLEASGGAATARSGRSGAGGDPAEK